MSLSPAKAVGLEQAGDAFGKVRRDGELAFVEELRETVEEFAPKLRAQDIDRKQEFLVRVDPPVLGIEAAAGHDAMNVRMKNEITGPGVDDGGNPEHAAQALRIAGELQEGSGGRGDQEVEEESLVCPHELAQLGGQREHDVEVGDGQRAFHALAHPSCLWQGLALGASAVATRVVDLALAPAIRTHVAVPAEGAGAADRDIPQRPALHRTERMGSTKRVPVTPE